MPRSWGHRARMVCGPASDPKPSKTGVLGPRDSLNPTAVQALSAGNPSQARGVPTHENPASPQNTTRTKGQTTDSDSQRLAAFRRQVCRTEQLCATSLKNKDPIEKETTQPGTVRNEHTSKTDAGEPGDLCKTSTSVRRQGGGGEDGSWMGSGLGLVWGSVGVAVGRSALP